MPLKLRKVARSLPAVGKAVNTPDKAAKRLFKYYFMAFSILIALIVTNDYLHRSTLERSALDAEAINIAGRQRMLSQRILFVGERYMHTGDAQYADRLNAALDTFIGGHDWLMENALWTDEIRALYFDSDNLNLDQRTREYVVMARTLFTLDTPEARELVMIDMEKVALDGLLGDLNAAVSVLETEANAHLADLTSQRQWMLAATLLVILFEILFIFVPVARSVVSAMKRLDHQANHDGLTGLVNRKRFWELLQDRLKDSAVPHGGMAIINVDLDGFKAINDTLGHPAGDQVLVRVAEILNEEVKKLRGVRAPVVARLGGDEFVVALSLKEKGAANAVEELGDRLLDIARDPVAIDLGDRRETAYFGFSFGYCFADEARGDPDTLVANADIALYASKNAGKSQMTRYHPGLRDEAERRHKVETDFRRAVLQSEFVPYYQPQICTITGAVRGVEVLSRWHHPIKGTLHFDQFGDAAAQSGMLGMIEGAIVFRALEEFSQARETGWAIPRLALNASETLLAQSTFAADFVGLCAMYEIPASDIDLEVTEDVLAGGGDEAARTTLQLLSDSGVRIVLDKFGAGYSSLATVSQSSTRAIKLDRKLISVCSGADGSKFLAAISAMCHGIGVEMIAVGIETDTQKADMKRLGCDVMQGNLLGKPVRIEDLMQQSNGLAASA